MLYFAFIPSRAQSMAHFTTRFNNNHHHPSTPVHVRHTRRHVTGTILMSPFPSAYANPRRAFCNAAPLPRIISISISRLAADVGIEIRPINKVNAKLRGATFGQERLNFTFYVTSTFPFSNFSIHLSRNALRRD